MGKPLIGADDLKQALGWIAGISITSLIGILSYLVIQVQSIETRLAANDAILTRLEHKVDALAENPLNIKGVARIGPSVIDTP